jgi:hypothetical protein
MKKVCIVAATVIAVLSLVCVIKVLAATVSGSAVVRPNLSHAATVGLTSPTESLGTIFTWAITSGTGANQMNMLFVDQRSLTNGATEELDLYNGVTNSFGDVLSFARVKMFAVGGASANASYITVGGSTNGAWTNWVDAVNDQINVRPGGMAAFFAPDATGYPVTSGTGDKVLFTNPSTNTITYDIYIGGASS